MAPSVSHSTFLPVVTVFSDGKIQVNWMGSYESTWWEDGGRTVSNYDDPFAHSYFIDGILGHGSEPERLRRLADYMEEHAQD